MSWADKQLKKHKLRKQIKEIMDSPEFQKDVSGQRSSCIRSVDLAP